MDNVETWLRARLDEDEQLIRRNQGVKGLGDDVARPEWHFTDDVDEQAADDYLDRFKPRRMLTEVEAKRRLIEQVGQYEAWLDAERGYGCSAEEILAGRCSTVNVGEILALRLLALPYADQSGYKEEWRP